MTLQTTIDALCHVGQIFSNTENVDLQTAAHQANAKNKWFTAENIELSLSYWGEKLTLQQLQNWIEKEGIIENTSPKTVGIVSAGNIPLVGLHDAVSALLTGHKVKVKLSSDDEPLMKFFIQQFTLANPALGQNIQAVDRLENIEAAIATGSNNTARYFEYYFGKYPNIIRKNRNSIAVLTGDESVETMQKIGFDMLSYFGKGCRNVTQLWAPQGYDWVKFLDALQGYTYLADHNKYVNNYHYHRAILLLNKDEHLDAGFLLVREDKKIYSPIGMVNYTYYNDINEVKGFITQNTESIQCVISERPDIEGAVTPGQTQNPELWEYADGVNTIQFLKGL